MREYSIGTIIDIQDSLPPGQIDLLVSLGKPRHHAKDDVIYHQGDPATAVFLIRSGQAKSVLINSNGENCLLRLHLRHSLLGLTAFATKPIRDAEAIATTDVELVEISRQVFLDETLAHPEIGVHVTRLLVDRMSDFHHRVGDFLAQNVEQRLAQSLLSLSRPDPEQQSTGERQPIRLTHEELASLLGARRPTITAILNRFAADGLVAKQGRAITVVDVERLGHLLQTPEL